MITANELLRAREIAGESQTQFGARLGVNQGTISRWESQGVPRDRFVQLAVGAMLAELQEEFDSPKFWAEKRKVNGG